METETPIENVIAKEDVNQPITPLESEKISTPLESEKNKSQEEFTSEIYKVEVKNLPRNVGFGGLKKFIASLDLKCIKVKSPGNVTFAFVTFSCEEERQRALGILNKATFKGRQLSATYAKATVDPIKRKNIESNGSNKAIKTESGKENIELLDDKTPEEKVQNATTPLWELPYEKQVEQKESHIKKVLRKTLFKMEKNNMDTNFWLKKQSADYAGMCCELKEFVKSPVIDKYRNKCEFTIGYDKTETSIKLGFRLGEYKTGSNEVVEPYACRNISDHMKSFTRKFAKYFDQSDYKPCNIRLKEGHWRQLTLRSNENKDILAIVIFDQKDLSQDQIQKEKEKLIEFLKENFIENQAESEQDFVLKSFLFNLNTNRTGISSMDNLELLIGQNYLNESLLGLNFRISPLAFFQSNSKGAELLYTKIGEICDLDKDTVLLDICCGTGTIGLSLANKAKLVVGVEIIAEAIEDAKLNAKFNNIDNVEFHCGKAEDILPKLLRRFANQKVVAIVDPPRAGLHNKVVQTLRHLNNLQNIIYVSCAPDLAMQNFVDLARDTSKQYANKPFVPLKAIAVDMFPHTSHCELILFFTRYSNELFSSSMPEITDKKE